MEHQTRYDLSAALENWRAELAAQPNLTAEVRRELETHLRDALAGFQQRGLTDEEAFWLARRRVGQPAQLGDEFVKADPAAVWRERVFWMAATLLVYSLWSTVANDATLVLISKVTNWRGQHSYPGSNYWFGLNPFFSGLLTSAVRLIPLGLGAVFLLQGRLHQNLPWVSWFRSRKNIVLLTAIIVVLNFWMMFGWSVAPTNFSGTTHQAGTPSLVIWSSLVPFVFWPLTLAGFTAWLLPPQNKKPAQSA